MPRPKRAAKEGGEGTSMTTSSERRDCLMNVTPDRNENNTDIDIIAIHGLDTKSPETWTWRSKPPDRDVNWLADPDMLPSQVENARIFTYDWYAELFPDASLTQVGLDQHAAYLLQCLQRELFANGKNRLPRPILFIASCLGGLILAKALILADDSDSDCGLVRQATGAVIFLATPFRGTSFKYVAKWAEVGLNFKAVLQDRRMSKLINVTKSPTADVGELITRFTRLCQDAQYPIKVQSFFELKKTRLPQKAFPCLPKQCFRERLLVDQSSASLDIMHANLPLGLMRAHSLMNKFMSSQCDDYDKVRGVIQSTAGIIWQGSPIHQADTIIRNNNYSARDLEIIRLSGDLLSMSQCYINLSIVRSMDQKADPDDHGISTLSFIRPPVWEKPLDQRMEVDLASLFDQREGSNSRRIFIRGRAGMGKTTLCKKIIHEFYHENKELRKSWAEVFDRILWIPLRNLKEKSISSFDQLFFHSFFETPQEQRHLAENFSHQWEQIRGRTLFLLDGLDEILPDLVHDSSANKFLTALLNQENVIITSRPSASLPSKLTPVHLDVEVIGFSIDQVEQYVKHVFTCDGNADDQSIRGVLEFLNKHWLMQSLMRIPIQLDALCFTWSDWADHRNASMAPETMTAIYRLMEVMLWRRDIVKMELKDDHGQVVNLGDISSGNFDSLVPKELKFITFLAFSGLHDNMIEFGRDYQDLILTKLRLENFLYAKQLPRLSFLRVSNPKSKVEHQKYHFIHLTFQEYFAAKYFVEKWHDPSAELDIPGSASCSARDYLRKYKYSPRYDVFWRFVSGLLRDEQEVVDVLRLVEQEPLDLLGPAHQRLLMHMLSEMPRDMKIRPRFERQVKEWVLFDTEAFEGSELVREIEIPEAVLNGLLQQDAQTYSSSKNAILRRLADTSYIPESTLRIIFSECIGDENIYKEVCGVLLDRPSPLPAEVLSALAKHLTRNKPSIRHGILLGLSNHQNLPCEILAAMKACLQDARWQTRNAAVESLSFRSTLPDTILAQLQSLLHDTEINTCKVMACLVRHSFWSDELYRYLTAYMAGSDRSQSGWIIEQFRNQQTWPPPEKYQMLLEKLLADKDREVCMAVAGVFRAQPSLPISTVRVIKNNIRNGRQDAPGGAISVLRSHPALCAELLDDIVAALDGTDFVQDEIGHLFRNMVLPPRIVSAVAQHLTNQDAQVRKTAAGILCCQPNLPPVIRESITAHFKDKAIYTREEAAENLGEWLCESDEALLGLVESPDKDLAVDVAIKALKTGRQSDLPAALHARVIREIDGSAGLDRRREVVGELCQRDLPNQILTAIASCLVHDDRELRIKALIALQNHHTTQDKFINDIATCLDDQDSDIVDRAIWELLRYTAAPKDVLLQVAARLRDCTASSRANSNAFSLLARQPELPLPCLHDLVDALVSAPTEYSLDLVEALRREKSCFLPWVLDALCPETSLASAFFRALLRNSFGNNFSMYLRDGELCFEFPEGIRKFHIKEGVAERMRGMRPKEFPAVCGIFPEGVIHDDTDSTTGGG